MHLFEIGAGANRIVLNPVVARKRIARFSSPLKIGAREQNILVHVDLRQMLGVAFDCLEAFQDGGTIKL